MEPAIFTTHRSSVRYSWLTRFYTPPRHKPRAAYKWLTAVEHLRKLSYHECSGKCPHSSLITCQQRHNARKSPSSYALTSTTVRPRTFPSRIHRATSGTSANPTT